MSHQLIWFAKPRVKLKWSLKRGYLSSDGPPPLFCLPRRKKYKKCCPQGALHCRRRHPRFPKSPGGPCPEIPIAWYSVDMRRCWYLRVTITSPCYGISHCALSHFPKYIMRWCSTLFRKREVSLLIVCSQCFWQSDYIYYFSLKFPFEMVKREPLYLIPWGWFLETT